ncbi:MAG: ABC-2 type transport system permease protein [Pseudohongiellaceae bacterium]|jgi:ABC-2 type transport system permease protein
MQSTLANIVRRRELIGVLVRTELETQAAGTRLGFLWWLIDPALTMLVYVLLFTVIFSHGDRYAPFPLFVLCGLLPWKHLASSLAVSTQLLRRREHLLKSVPFPSIVLPLSTVLSGAVYLAAGLALTMVAAALWGRPMNGALLQLVPLLALQVAVVAGLSLVLACLGVLMRDISRLMEHLLRFGLYCSPVLYGLDQVRDSMGPTAETLYMLNPMAILITGYRDALFYGQIMDTKLWLMLLVEAALLLPAGYLFYRRFDSRLIKEL